MKIKQVLAELKKERSKIDKAIVALERLANDSSSRRRRQSPRSKVNASRQSVFPPTSNRSKPTNSKIIQFAPPVRRANSN